MAWRRERRPKKFLINRDKEGLNFRLYLFKISEPKGHACTLIERARGPLEVRPSVRFSADPIGLAMVSPDEHRGILT